MGLEAQAFGDRFDRSIPYYETWLEDLTTEVPAVLEGARHRYLAMGPDLAYADEPDHPMAFSLFTCASLLCLYLELEARGVDVHAFGSRMIQALKEALGDRGVEQPEPDPAAVAESVASLQSAGVHSQKEAKEGTFVFDVQWIDEPNAHWTMNMSSCGICQLFGRYGAMDLVPYMCATDDVMSEAQGQGLVRTGTIALGSGRCDFDYQPGRASRPIATLYPDRIRLRE
jgi:hypothetical protein